MAHKGEPQRYFRDVVLPYEGDECLPWPFACTEGYGVLYRSSGTRLVHRRVCEEAYGPAPTPNHQAAHSCGNGHLSCCAKRHLAWRTPKANNADKIAHDTLLIGERHQNSKLTGQQVRAILELKGSKLQREIAAEFGVTPSLVSQIHQRRIWTHIKIETALYASEHAAERFAAELEDM